MQRIIATPLEYTHTREKKSNNNNNNNKARFQALSIITSGWKKACSVFNDLISPLSLSPLFIYNLLFSRTARKFWKFWKFWKSKSLVRNSFENIISTRMQMTVEGSFSKIVSKTLLGKLPLCERETIFLLVNPLHTHT